MQQSHTLGEADTRSRLLHRPNPHGDTTMWHFIKYVCTPVLLGLAILFGLMAHLASKAEAQPADPTTYCSSLAHFAEKVAIDRDIGYSRGQVLAAVAEAFNARGGSDLFFIVDLVYARPHGTPDQEAHITFERCWTAYGRG